MENVHEKTPTLRIDLDSGIPLARQIVDGLRTLLVSGELAAGDRLPSSRRLAVDLGVHFNTVAQAYRELEGEGWLVLNRKQGTFVAGREQTRPRASDKPRLLDEFRQELVRLAARYRSQGLEAEELLAISKEEMNDD
jgi:GntR family transcriptional regulator